MVTIQLTRWILVPALAIGAWLLVRVLPRALRNRADDPELPVFLLAVLFVIAFLIFAAVHEPNWAFVIGREKLRVVINAK
jgi:hypothetical protein